jgi:hypothetical protein
MTILLFVAIALANAANERCTLGDQPYLANPIPADDAEKMPAV